MTPGNRLFIQNIKKLAVTAMAGETPKELSIKAATPSRSPKPPIVMGKLLISTIIGITEKTARKLTGPKAFNNKLNCNILIPHTRRRINKHEFFKRQGKSSTETNNLCNFSL